MGEWGVLRTVGDAGRTEVCKDGHMLRVPTDSLTLVAPPLPPEPPVGSVVFADGESWMRGGVWWMTGDTHASWPDIAARAVPAVDPTNDDHLKAAGLCRVDDVAEALDYEGLHWMKRLIVARFGGA
jgi:hypothetical protein